MLLSIVKESVVNMQTYTWGGWFLMYRIDTEDKLRHVIAVPWQRRTKLSVQCQWLLYSDIGIDTKYASMYVFPNPHKPYFIILLLSMLPYDHGKINCY